ncbi:DUF2064 domain-containing protein [Salinactinospora qingdaonensis]|uniref:DUF2064 domain-containing protein n=1 Tax=Salinactinospora qingdaonensis TaxID=702744 RepID=UPI0031E5A4B2
MKRTAAVLVTPTTGAAPPPGVDAADYASALVEDTYDLVSGLRLCDAAVIVWGASEDGALVERATRIEELTWPGTPVLPVAGAPAARRSLEVLAENGAEEAVLVAADAPDLPPLLIGKLFRALGTADIAVSPAQGGGLTALAAHLPPPAWLADTGLDTPEAMAALAAGRPTRRALGTAPGWHRLRQPADVAHLDPGLEGWDATRGLLSAR